MLTLVLSCTLQQTCPCVYVVLVCWFDMKREGQQLLGVLEKNDEFHQRLQRR